MGSGECEDPAVAVTEHLWDCQEQSVGINYKLGGGDIYFLVRSAAAGADEGLQVRPSQLLSWW